MEGRSEILLSDIFPFSLFSLVFALLVVFQVFEGQCKSVTEVGSVHSWLSLALIALLGLPGLLAGRGADLVKPPQRRFYARIS